jgi:hypothetical protein
MSGSMGFSDLHRDTLKILLGSHIGDMMRYGDSAFRSSWAAFSSAEESTSMRARWHFRAASPPASDRPRPFAAPVTTATLPSYPRTMDLV